MASWYQSGSVALPGRFTMGHPGSGSCEVIEVALGAHSAVHPEQVGWQRCRREVDEVARALPQEAVAAQQVVDLERAIRWNAQRGEIEVHHAVLRMERVEVDHDDHRIALGVGGGLAVAEQLRVVRRVKPEGVVLLESRMLPPGPIQGRDQ